MSEEPKLEEIEFAENPEPRCPCVLLLDTSGSMSGSAINALNEGLQTFKNALTEDGLASRRVEIAIVTFDSKVNVVQDFVTADQFEPTTLSAGGATAMGTGIVTGLDMVQNRKTQYRENGITYYRPWIFMITDGEPQGEANDIIDQASQRIKTEEENKSAAFFAVGVEGANMEKLQSIAARAPVKLNGLNFGEMFVWLSASMQRVSHSKVDEQVDLPPLGWGTV
ncbi:MAG: VWA domain-containing protein [Candidatus Latescibacteria bacterium]|nr:VWA domain-containing protein [Candidatus Latescibacterota bacterium]